MATASEVKEAEDAVREFEAMGFVVRNENAPRYTGDTGCREFVLYWNGLAVYRNGYISLCRNWVEGWEAGRKAFTVNAATLWQPQAK
jgi:hypothetical protein